MKKSFIWGLIPLVVACSSTGYEKTPTGVLVNVDNNPQVKTIQLDVVNDNIIHVKASNTGVFSDKPSLIVPDTLKKTGTWSVEENNGQVVLKTASVKALVTLQTGEIAFQSADGTPILTEKKGGGKSFEKGSEDGLYQIQQVFESSDDEGFYGLGQHQSDEFNYKGRNEELYQYNTKVSIPFIVSTKNYGVLWENYSLSRFGDKRPYADLNQFKLYGKDGKDGGLTATYLENSDPSKVFALRNEEKVDYENLETVKNFPANFPFNNASIKWEGELEPNESGVFHFKLYYAGYTKVYINNELVVPERWRTAWNPNSYKFKINLEKGKRYPVRLEWKPDGGVSYISLKALSPVSEQEQNQLSFWSEAGRQLEYYFVAGDNMDGVIKGYRTITGKSPIMPKWAMGYWQSRERYKTQDELLGVVKEYRKRNIPIDNIVQDWSYWKVEDWGSHEFDAARFPDPKAMIDSVHAMNARIMISVWPKFYHTTDNYKAFDKNGWMYTRAVKDSIRDWIGQGYIGSFYDAYSEGARKMFWDQINEKLYSKGIDAWWMDASEPDILSNASMDYRKALSTPTAMGSSTEFFNAYALVNAMAIYNGQRATNPDSRVFLLTRSGFAGLQRYSTATWSGDIGTRWEDMKAQISAGLNYAISGIPYWTMDIGGFCVEKRYEQAKEGSEDMNEWRELNARWFQFGAFCPLFRSHGQFPLREIYNMAPENHPTFKSMVYYTKLRYRLMPYIYTLASKTFFDDYTIMRALVMDYTVDKNVFNISDQYMFGPSLMVAPVHQYKARAREVYLPQNTGWYDFYTGVYYQGGQTIQAQAPVEQIPLFVKEGAIIPYGPEIQYTAQKSDAPVTILVYTGKDGSFNLYEDEGLNYNYEKGKYAVIPMSYNEATQTLIIGERKGGFEGMAASRQFRIVWMGKNKPVKHDLEISGGKVVDYNGSQLVIKNEVQP
jgi:alpha-D-xyloside xylohydrolase